MNRALLLRAAFALLALFCAWAAATSTRRVRGDAASFPLPNPRRDTPPERLVYLEGALERAIRLNPLQWEAYLKMARVQAALGRRDRAIVELRKTRQYYLAMEALEFQARLALSSGRHAEAAATYGVIRRLSVVDRPVFRNAALVYALAEDWKALAEIGREAEMRWPDDRETLVGLANADSATGEIELALKRYALALAARARRGGDGAFSVEDVRRNASAAARELNFRSDWAKAFAAAADEGKAR